MSGVARCVLRVACCALRVVRLLCVCGVRGGRVRWRSGRGRACGLLGSVGGFADVAPLPADVVAPASL
eukprot:5677335-Lingulodinium_polyedra.AAC.1